MMNIHEIKEQLNDLDILIQYIKDIKLLNNYKSILVDAIESRFHDCDCCPRCGRTHIKKNEHYKNRLQRYQCHDCKSAFSPYTCTILENIKLRPII